MASIDFRGKEGALDAYKSANIDTWAVFNKKNIMQSGNGEQLLSDYLDLMETHSSTTVYTLKMYRKVDADDVTEKTECNSSFSFQLADAPGLYMRGGGVPAGNNTGSLYSRIASLESQLREKEKEKEEKPTIGSTVLGWLQDPEDIIKMIGAVKLLFSKPTPETTQQLVSALSGVQPKLAGANIPEPVNAEPMNQQLKEQQEEGLTEEQEASLYRYANVIDRGEKVDKDFLSHMEQLVALAESNPAMYQIGLGFLKQK